MEQVELPTYDQYMAKVEELIKQNQLTVEQGVILRNCYKARANGTAVHINYLIAATGLNWKRINAILNGLVLRGAIRKVEKKWYTL